MAGLVLHDGAEVDLRRAASGHAEGESRVVHGDVGVDHHARGGRGVQDRQRHHELAVGPRHGGWEKTHLVAVGGARQGRRTAGCSYRFGAGEADRQWRLPAEARKPDAQGAHCPAARLGVLRGASPGARRGDSTGAGHGLPGAEAGGHRTGELVRSDAVARKARCVDPIGQRLRERGRRPPHRRALRRVVLPPRQRRRCDQPDRHGHDGNGAGAPRIRRARGSVWQGLEGHLRLGLPMWRATVPAGPPRTLRPVSDRHKAQGSPSGTATPIGACFDPAPRPTQHRVTARRGGKMY